MMRLGKAFLIALAILIANGTAHARMVMQTFAVLAGAGAHDVYPAPDRTVWFTARTTRYGSATGVRMPFCALIPRPRSSNPSPYPITTQACGSSPAAGASLGCRIRGR